MTRVIYSWRTKKSGSSFKYEVLQMTDRKKPTKKLGHYVVTKVIKTGYLPTRARAKAQAQRWVRYYNSRLKS